MNKEIERKYLISKRKQFNLLKPLKEEKILQVYTKLEGDFEERVRMIMDIDGDPSSLQFIKTSKQETGDMIERIEKENRCSLEVFVNIIDDSLNKHGHIKYTLKDRAYYSSPSGHKYTIDDFAYHDILLLEIELGDAKETFKLDDDYYNVSAEVTELKKFRNRNLALTLYDNHVIISLMRNLAAFFYNEGYHHGSSDALNSVDVNIFRR